MSTETLRFMVEHERETLAAYEARERVAAAGTQAQRERLARAESLADLKKEQS